jgi:carbonic anhydrase
LDTCHALGLEPGDAHLIRNAGGIITDDVLRSLLISQHLLGTNAVMLIHHTGCGLAGLDPHAVVVEVERRTGSQPPMDIGAFSDVELDVRAGIERIRSASYLPHREIVRGFVYDVLTGRLREVRWRVRSSLSTFERRARTVSATASA